MSAQSLIHRTGMPTVQRDRSVTNVGAREQTVQLSPRQSVDKRTLPTELFVTSLSLRRLLRIKTETRSEPQPRAYQEGVDHAKLSYSNDELLAVFNGYWWASSADMADKFWASEFSTPFGYEIVARDTVRVPRHLLEATRVVQKVGRASVYLPLFALAGLTVNRRGRHAAYASYIRATTAEMAVRLWQTQPNGLPSAEKSVACAFEVRDHWIHGVLQSPPIAEAIEHDRVIRLGG